MAPDDSSSVSIFPPIVPHHDPLSGFEIDFSVDQPVSSELPFPKKEEMMDHPLFPGTVDDSALDSVWTDECLVPVIPDEAWIGIEGLMTALLGQEQSISGITLNDDLFMVANNESSKCLSRVPNDALNKL
jgi:hypothetical protein